MLKPISHFLRLCHDRRVMTGILCATGLLVAGRLTAESPPSGASGENRSTTNAPRVMQPGDLFLEGSRVYMHVDKVGLGHEHAVSGQLLSGSLRLDAAANPGELVFDMPSFLADTEDAREYIGLPGTTDADTQRKVNANMLGADVLDVKRYPTARFAVKKIVKSPKPTSSGKVQYKLAGEFTLHGVTRPIEIIAEADDKEREGWTHLRGNFKIHQTHYGMKPYSKGFGAIGVADELEVYGDLWLAQRVVKLEAKANANR